MDQTPDTPATGDAPSGDPLRTDPIDYHVPVMVTETVELLAPVAPGVVVDATFGGGGHTKALLEAVPSLSILALDRDPDASRRVPVDTRVRFVAANFGDLTTVLADPETRAWIDERDIHGAGRGLVAGVLFDLGVSSHQLDRAERGFSYHQAGPLDMRMGPDASLTAADIVNEWDVAGLTDIFRRYGEERFARRIAQRIVAERPFADTTALADTVAAAYPAPARRAGHPARKVFQAIRIAVNDELGAVERGLDAAVAALREPGKAGTGSTFNAGRCVVMAYHSLEDRIVKRRFTAGATGCTCPPEIPVCVCGNVAELRRITRKSIRPSESEVERNPRARSARLRAVERAEPHALEEVRP